MAGSFLDMQAYVGITKHIGGLPATRALLALCHVDDAREILEVGCGIGVGPAHAARTYDCRVVGVDISERMVEWSRRRAREEGVQDRIEFRVADVLALPFEADRFDATLCESVLAFVNRDVLVLANLGSDPVALPDGAKVLHMSAALDASDGTTLVPRDTTVWVRLAA